MNNRAVISVIVSEVGDRSRGRPEGSLFYSCYEGNEEEGTTPFPGLLHFTLDTHLILLSVTIFKIFGMTRSGIESKSPGPLANTLPTRPIV